ncbi:MAG TPA: type IV pilus secretin PilQ [Acidobacteriota bacterium]|nr:type IV pilus secretin PilQ [Acidobacteriota bacterium]
MITRSVELTFPRQRRGRGVTGKSTFVCLLLLAFCAFGAEQKPPDLVRQQPSAVRQPVPSQAAKTDKTAKLSTSLIITNVATAKENDRFVVSVASSGLMEYKEFALDNPSRLVVDFLNVASKVAFLQQPVNFATVKHVRYSQFQASDPPIARLVFELEDTHGKHEIMAEDHIVRVVFHATSQPAEEKPAPAEDPKPKAVHEDPQPSNSEPTPAPAPAPPPARAPAAAPVIRDLAATEIPVSAPAAAKPAPQEPRPPEPVPPPNSPVKPADPAPAPAPPAAPARVINIAASEDSIYAGQPLTLDLVDIPLVDFFRLMAEEGGINVVMDPEIKGTISIKVVKVPWDQIFDAALLNHSLDKKVEGNLVRIATKKTLQSEASQQESLKKATLLAADVETRIKRLNYAKAQTLVTTLQDQKSVRGTVVVDERTNSLIVTDIPPSVDRVLKLVESLDIPQPQVEIEARIVSATRDFARDIGIQFGFVQGNLQRVSIGGPNTFGTIGGTRPAATPTTTFAAGDFRTGRGASESTSSQSAGVSTGTSSQKAGNFNVNLPAEKAFGGLGISVGNIFDTFLLDAAITAGENKGLAKLISQPKVTAQNNSPAMITQRLRFPVQIIANNTISVQFQNAALTLTVTPQITYEGNIVLDLKVENNTPDFSRAVNGIPSIRTSESTTRVLVSDGGTTVIGGILVENESSTEDRVPGLASLPMIGNLFRRTSISRSTQEVLFFITPRVIK